MEVVEHRRPHAASHRDAVGLYQPGIGPFGEDAAVARDAQLLLNRWRKTIDRLKSGISVGHADGLRRLTRRLFRDFGLRLLGAD